MLDRERALAYLAELRAALGDWERYQRVVGRARLEQDRDARNAMLVAVQAAIDIGGQILAERRFDRPASYQAGRGFRKVWNLVVRRSAPAPLH